MLGEEDDEDDEDDDDDDDDKLLVPPLVAILRAGDGTLYDPKGATSESERGLRPAAGARATRASNGISPAAPMPVGVTGGLELAARVTATTGGIAVTGDGTDAEPASLLPLFGRLEAAVSVVAGGTFDDPLRPTDEGTEDTTAVGTGIVVLLAAEGLGVAATGFAELVVEGAAVATLPVAAVPVVLALGRERDEMEGGLTAPTGRTAIFRFTDPSRSFAC